MKLHRVQLGLGGGRIWQIAQRGPGQNMSYVFETPEGSVAVLDGGDYCEGDGRYLYDFLRKLNGTVNTWMFTHGHEDHIGAILWMFENIPDFNLQINRICFHFPPTEWFGGLEGGGTMSYVDRFQRQIETRKIPVQKVYTGDTIYFGGISADVLSDPSNYLSYTTEINSSTVVWKIHYPKCDILFLGDLSVEGQNDLLKKINPSQLKCDVVQVSHHGQNGVDRNFYRLVSAKHCLWCTPPAVWESNNSREEIAGNSHISETLRWLNEFGAEAHYVTALGDYLFT